MNFELSEDHKVLIDSIKDFVDNEIKPIALEIDEKHEIPQSLISQMSELGFLGTYIPEEYGGAGMDYFSYILTVEEVSKACASSAVLIAAHTSLCCGPILSYGTEEQKKKFLPALASGEKIGCFLQTEPNAGSDVANIETKYVEEEDCYVITGSKIFITNGAYKGTGIVIATKDKSLGHKGLSAFIVDLSTPGVEVMKNEVKMGIRGSYTTAFGLDGVRVPKENLLSKEGDGFKIAMETLNAGRISIGAQALGIAEGAFERSVDYTQERKQFGKPLSAFQAVSMKLADMKVRIEQSKMMIYKAVWLKENNKPYIMESAMAKLSASETATFVTKDAIQVHGGYGFICEYEVERMYRDAKITEIYEGTSEIQRVIIGKMLIK
ncbi:MAG: acyl-CoA dehydrogenase family protein [Arcobacter sp.]|jgi:butyryl-CoA dehydrogenase|uniref:acyl-CoA dehydrogenase family protein n=1 Tax=unclassified Arcobacter TaxID=2593671 RepID=UPI0002295BC4|nr:MULTISPECIES: acyl-CoA dehydrogenase family protein [unclassified Arcobacter]MDY3200177.1 acyl-CoA dehydrogenase family protein [Arcobacter sp.]BAK71982.1 acyl-CoA dehydrogenase [Arcobacter sp. L]